MIDHLLQDVRHGFRVLRREPGFTAVALLILAVGIGANAALFSVVNAVLLRQLPFRDPSRLMFVWSSRADNSKAPFSLPDFLDYRDQNRSFEGLAGIGTWNVNLTGAIQANSASPFTGGSAERLSGVRVSADLFNIMGVNAVIGRTLLPDDDRPGAPHVVVLQYGLWQRRFGADPSIVGRSILLNGEAYTVVGVLPPNFSFPMRTAELACALSPETDPWRLNRETVNFLRLVGRLRPGVSPSQAAQDMNDVARRLAQLYPHSNATKNAVTLVRLEEAWTGDFRMALWTLQAAVGLVLLIAGANLAHLMLARGSSRGREAAIRAALGASRGRVLQQWLTESLLLAVIGGSLGLLLAHWGIPLLLAFSPAALPRAQEASLDGRVLAFTLACSTLVAVGFGLAPALAAARVNVNGQLAEGGRSAAQGSRGHALRHTLVVIEVGLSLVLLTATGLVLRSFWRMLAVDPGFRSDHVLVLQLSLPKARYSQASQTTRFYEQLVARLEALPGVESASVNSQLPLGGGLATVDFTIVGRPPVEQKDIPSADFRMIGSKYFEVMSIPILEGRGFSERDTGHSAPVAVISENIALRYWPRGGAVGEQLTIDDVDVPQGRRVEIVGVVGDVHNERLDAPPSFHVYIPSRQVQPENVVWLASNQHWVVRTAGNPLAMADTARRAVQEVDSDVAASSVLPMDQYLARSTASRRFNVQLLGVFGVAALLLAAGGIYGVVSYSVAQRTHEFGLRMTFGARPRDIILLVARQTFAPAALGLLLGLAGSWILSRVLSSLLFGISATDPLTYGSVACLLAVVAAAATGLPAIRATRIAPLTAIRG